MILLGEDIFREIFLEHNGVCHDELVPELDTRESHFRIAVFHGHNELVEVIAALVSLHY